MPTHAGSFYGLQDRPVLSSTSPSGFAGVGSAERLTGARLERENRAGQQRMIAERLRRQKELEQDRLDRDAQARLQAQYGGQFDQANLTAQPSMTRDEAIEDVRMVGRGLRNFFTPYEEVNRSVSAASDGRPLAAAAWGGLAALGVIPFVGGALRGVRGVAGAASGAARAGTSRAAAGSVTRAATTPPPALNRPAANTTDPDFWITPEAYKNFNLLDVPHTHRQAFVRLNAPDNNFSTTVRSQTSESGEMAELGRTFFPEATQYSRSASTSPYADQIARDLQQSFVVRRSAPLERFGFNPKSSNPVHQRQQGLVGMYGEIGTVNNLGDAVAHWQYVGNENIQSLLRTGGIALPNTPEMNRTLRRIENFSGLDRAGATRVFEQNAAKSVRLLDDFVSGSTGHGGFTAFRGVQGDSLPPALRPYIFGRMGSGQPLPVGPLTGPMRPSDMIGRQFSDRAFTAVSLDSGKAWGFARNSVGFNKGVVLQIDVPPNVGAGSVSGSLDRFSPQFTNEFEMILGRGSVFEVTDVSFDQLYDDVAAIIKVRVMR